jgi:hypothetical protein
LREPFNLSPADLNAERLGTLTPWQVKNLLFRKEARLMQGEVQPYRKLFWDHWRRHGKSEAEILKRWQDEGHDGKEKR